MVVDDEPDIALLTGHLLKLEGFEVDYFTTGDAAFIQFLKSPKEYSVIVSDVRMPDVNGIELAHAIHELNPEVPIVFITAFDMRNKDLPAFMNKEDVIKKPFLGRHLSQRLVQILKQRQTARN